MRMRWMGLLAVLLTSVGCSEKTEGDFNSPVASVEVVPLDQVVDVSPGFPLSVQYMAHIVREDGTEQDLAEVGWTSSNLSLGEFDDMGMFHTTDATGGQTIIRATYLGVTGEAMLTVNYFQEIVEGDAPEGAADLFVDDPVEGSADAPVVIYPYDQVRIPRNTPQITFMVEAGEVCNLFQYKFTTSTTRVDVYTTDVSWVPEDTAWNAIAANNGGSDTLLELSCVEYHLDGNTPVADSDVLAAESSVTLRVSRLDAAGSIYYWSASNEGVYRILYGGEQAQNYYGLTSYGHCVSCHAVSPDGTMLSVTYDGENSVLGILAMEEPTNDDAAVIAYDDGVHGNFKTFSPDSSKLVVTYDGNLYVYDTATGELLYDVILDQPVTQPSWSPAGDKVAVVVVPEEEYRMDYIFSDGKIATLDVDENGVIGTEPTILFESEEFSNAYYPAFSPDGNWIAFNRSWDTGQAASSFDSYDDPSATLFVISVDGEQLYELAAANSYLVDEMTEDDYITNSWPSWAPLPDADIAWLTFSSKRNYGFVTSIEDNRPQIWVTGFDIEAAEAGKTEDPSSPPFWLPFQDSDSNNHIAIWGPA